MSHARSCGRRARRCRGFRAGVRITLASALLSACTGGRAASASADPAGAATLEPVPALAGAEILQRACTSCHDLEGLSVFADYWGEPEWRSLIDTMISYGARLGTDEYEVLAGYLAERYERPTPDSVP